MAKFTNPTQTAATQELRALKRAAEQNFVGRAAVRASQNSGTKIESHLDDAGMDFYEQKTDLAITIVRAVAAALKVSYDAAKALVGNTRLGHELIGSGVPANVAGMTDDLPKNIGFRGQPVSIRRFMALAASGGAPLFQP
jgi:hypothetical protein